MSEEIQKTETMAEDGKVKTFNVVFNVEGKAVGKMRNEIKGQMVSPVVDEAFEMATDEGPAHGGDMTAPPPLAYFCTGVRGLPDDPDPCRLQAPAGADRRTHRKGSYRMGSPGGGA